MYIFRSINEIVNTIATAKALLTELFEKRNLTCFRYSDALSLLKDDENKLQLLIEKEIIRQNGSFVEMDTRFLDFFEDLLEANEEINTATIDEHIDYLHELMDYYLKEKIVSRKDSYLRNIKVTFRKISHITIRNMMNLQQNIDNAFKHEPTYQIKIAKLKNLDKRRINIQHLIDKAEKLILEEEREFFRQATDEELAAILLEVRQALRLSGHSLIRAQQDIINYLNQIKNQIVLVEKIRKVKHLQDLFELRVRSNIAEVMDNEHSILLEGAVQPSFKLSPVYLASDDARPVILKVLSNQRDRERIRTHQAGAFSEDELAVQETYEAVISMEELLQQFKQASASPKQDNAPGTDLFNFLLSYTFHRPVSEKERTTLFCQLVSLYEDQFCISDTYDKYNEYEYAKIYAKK